MRTPGSGWRQHRFAAIVLGGVAASLGLLAVLLATATTPEEARAQRAIPDLPRPTMAVETGSGSGSLLVPAGAIVTDASGHTWVTVWADSRPHRVEVRRVSSDRSSPVQVTAVGLHAGDRVELVASHEAEAPPRAGAP